MRPRILIVTPARASENNGNYHTAARWAAMLDDQFDVNVANNFSGQTADALIALHAKKSASAIAAFRSAFPNTPILLALTGTDLYGDLPQGNQDAIASMRAANSWIALQDDAPRFIGDLLIKLLPDSESRDIFVVYQSAAPLPTAQKSAELLNAAFVGHLRDVKSPQTLFEAVRLLPRDVPIGVNVAGNALEGALAAQATTLAAEDSRFAWLGGLLQDKARELIRQAHVLVVPSKMEGGANVIAEALTSGTPVIASRVSGNVGMLGADWPAYFSVGDARALAALLLRCHQDRAFLATLNTAAAARARYFSPDWEATSLHTAVSATLQVAQPT